ncbi:MAG: hypothetical protein HY791_20460 [Deltaproteobacteria bacterium]|nr:hypothetical protein [Deltaproteobacteria bacterium]
MTHAPLWRELLSKLNEQEAATPDLYVEPKRAASVEVTSEFDDEPQSRLKFLLVGAQGGGKSTELSRISRLLAPRTQSVGIDLDASGVNASTVGAFDLLYLSGLAMLSLLPAGERKPLFAALSRAYADSENPADLGSVDQAVDSLATFGTLTSTAAEAVGLMSPGLGPAISVIRAGKFAVRLLQRGVVAETSPQGSKLAFATHSIAQTLEAREPGRPLCVLIDGLEKMNGESEARFRELFESTSLLVQAPWATVISSPPCTMTVTNGAENRGWRSKVVWGFGDDQQDSLVKLVRRRFDATGMGDACVANAQLEELVKTAGCLPRHVIRLCREAVRSANQASRSRIEKEDVAHASRRLAESLGNGLTDEDFAELQYVRHQRKLRRNESAARLFADGRILAYPPPESAPFVDWRVHPALAPYFQLTADTTTAPEPA